MNGFPNPERVAESYRDRVKGSRPGLDFLEVYFAHDPLPDDAPAFCFQHTMKTGGTSIRALIYRNLASTADLVLRYVPKKHPDFHAFYTEFYADLSDGERERMWWVISHSASHLVPLMERPVHAFTIVREPVDRILSRFSYPVDPSRRVDDLAAIYDGLADSAKGEAKLISRPRRFDYANSQSRWLLRPYYDVDRELAVSGEPPPDADLWRTRLRELIGSVYTLLLHERLDESFARFVAPWKWDLENLERFRVNASRLTVDEIEPGLWERIRAFNWLDEELYAHARERYEQDEPAE